MKTMTFAWKLPLASVLTTAFVFAVTNACADEMESDLVAMADSLQAALKNSDESAIRELLDEDVLIYESGGVESSFEEYAGHHMGADMTFMQGIEREVISRKVIEDENIGIVTTHARLTGKYRNRSVNIVSNESLVMEKQEGAWRITHIHWSSK